MLLIFPSASQILPDWLSLLPAQSHCDNYWYTEILCCSLPGYQQPINRREMRFYVRHAYMGKGSYNLTLLE